MVANSLTMDDVRWCGLQGAMCGGDISGVHYMGIGKIMMRMDLKLLSRFPIARRIFIFTNLLLKDVI